MARKTWKKKTRSKHEAFVRYYNQGLPNAQVAGALHCSVRTVCRWKRAVQHAEGEMKPRPRTRRIRQRAYGAAVFELAVRLKQELPLRSAAAIARLMQKEFPGQCPSESTIRKYLAGKGFTFKKVANRQGYVKFQRDKPNDLWQVDIAGVQSVGHSTRADMSTCSRSSGSRPSFPPPITPRARASWSGGLGRSSGPSCSRHGRRWP